MNATRLKKLHIFVTITYIIISLIEIVVLVKDIQDKQKKKTIVQHNS